MKLRDLYKENPNHREDWQSVKYESLTHRKPDADSLVVFQKKWLAGVATLSDWLEHRMIDLSTLKEGLTTVQKKVVNERRHQLYDWWLEYKVRFVFLKELKDVITFAPGSVKNFAEQKLKEFDKYLAGELTGFAPFMFTNALGLMPKKDYPALMKQLEKDYDSLDRIDSQEDLPIAAALHRYHGYLHALAAEGIDEESDVVQPEENDEYIFGKYWPEILKLSQSPEIEYISKNTYYEDQAYVSYQVKKVGGFYGAYSLKNNLTQSFDTGFNNLMADIRKLDVDNQMDILKGLKDETTALADIVIKGEYNETGDEMHDGRRYEFIYFPHAIFRGDNDVRLATNGQSRLYLAKGMTDFPEAWLEAIGYMERKLEHSINNLHLMNEGVPKFSYEIQKLFKDIYIIESESAMLQGTAFYLDGVGLITCYHCVTDRDKEKYADDLVIFHSTNLGKKYPVDVVKANAVVDLAIIRLREEKQLTASGLVKGDSDAIKYLDPVAVAGFPNYNFGDTGYFTTGQVTGFRAVSGITHVLVSNNLVEGNSGGPAFDEHGQVIGVVVTGSESFQNAVQTEKHGIIPINVLQFLG